MKKRLKIYFAGKIDPASRLGQRWRDNIALRLETLLKYTILNLDPNKDPLPRLINYSNPLEPIGRNASMIKDSDLVIIMLSEDISVGGSCDMMIAKYFGKPVIGIAQKGGKFRKKKKMIREREYLNYTHPYVALFCDYLAEDVNEAAKCILRCLKNSAPTLAELLRKARGHHTFIQ